MNKDIFINEKLKKILKIIFFLSIPTLSLFLCRNCDKWVMIISLILSCLSSFFLIKYIFRDIFNKIKIFYFLIAFAIADYILGIYYMFHYASPYNETFYSFAYWKLILFSIGALLALSLIIYFLLIKFIPFVKYFVNSLTKNEKRYIIFTFFATFVLTIIIYNITSAFYYVPNILYDIIFTSDSSALFGGDAFFNINMEENDLRQPLFGFFALPFALIAKLLSDIFFFIPNGYAVFLTTIQISLLSITQIMIIHLFKFNKEQKLNFILLYLSSFSTIVFSFVIEQYIIALFYLILAIYSYYNIKREVNYAYLGSVGTMLTSGILFPFISHFKNIKYWLKNIFKCLLAFLLILIIFGQLPQIFIITEKINSLFSFTGESVDFSNKIAQYLNFVSGIFVAPETIVDNSKGYWGYYLDPVNHFSILGIIILVICIISTILNRKSKMAIISMGWIVFSFILLCIIGWGTKENGLNLYSLYFSWAFIVLVYLFIDKIISKKNVKTIIVIILSLILLYFNISEFINIIIFGAEYYPK